MSPSSRPWPYPHLIAHRGAGRHAPENTLASLRLGARHGFRMAEVDVRLSRDGIPILLHDDTLARTTSGQGNAVDHDFSDLAQLDAGAWHSPGYAGEPLPTLRACAASTLALGLCSNLELKPHPGDESRTGAAVAALAARLWSSAPVPPLLSSFSESALAAARVAAPSLPRAWLLDGPLPADWAARASRLGCVSLHLPYQHIDTATLSTIHEAGYAVVAWTVNDPTRLHELLAWGCDGIVTDETERFGSLAAQPQP